MKRKDGFTLIEIIVVIVILAVLMAVAVPSVLRYINTANDAPALTEAHAIVIAAQKRVVDKYAEDRIDNIVLDEDDNEWIEEFVGEAGSIIDLITVEDKEVIRVLYKASNGLYVLYDNYEYKIVSGDEITDNPYSELLSMTSEYNEMIIDLYNANVITKYVGRDTVIKELAKNNEFLKVSDDLKEVTGSTSDLYWKPYYLGTADNPIVMLFANSSQSDHGAWKTSLIYINETLYTCPSSTSISQYYKYNTLDELQDMIESQPDIYQKINK